MLPVIITEQKGNGEWGIACLDGRSGAVLWRRALPSQAVCGFFWDRSGAASLPLHSRDQFVEAAMDGVSSDGAIVIHQHKGSLFLLPVPGIADLSVFANIGDLTFEKSAALALISSPQPVQHQLAPAGDGRWQSPWLDGCAGGSRQEAAACIAGVYRISASDMSAASAARSGPSPAQPRGSLIGPGQGAAVDDEGWGGGSGPGGGSGAWYLYYAAAGVLVWPALAALAWLLATQGPRTRVQVWVTACIDWAHSRLHHAEPRPAPPPAPPAPSPDGPSSAVGGEKRAAAGASGEAAAPGVHLRPQCAMAGAGGGGKGAREDGRGGGVVAESPTSGTEHTWSKGDGPEAEAEAEAEAEVSGATSWGTGSDTSNDSARRARPGLAIPRAALAGVGDMDCMRLLDEEARKSKVGRRRDADVVEAGRAGYALME
jgi:hypothetical protein